MSEKCQDEKKPYRLSSLFGAAHFKSRLTDRKRKTYMCEIYKADEKKICKTSAAPEWLKVSG